MIKTSLQSCLCLIAIVGFTLFLNGCGSKPDITPLTAPTISFFSPESGAAGTVVTVTGTNFSPVIGNNFASVSGFPAEVTSASSSQLTIIIPTGATTGKISVAVNLLTGTSAADFVVFQAPTIASFTPEYYQEDTTPPTVTITGTNFSTTLSENTVKFNNVSATVLTASATELTATVPASATTGKISVAVHGLSVESSGDFVVGCPDLIVMDIAVSNIAGNAFTVTYHLKNIGTIPLNLGEMYLQAYVAKAISSSTPGADLQGAGGFGKYGCCGNTEPLLLPNEIREKSNSVNNGGNSITTYPYVILNINPELDGPVECHDDVNELGIKIQP